jgi:hypothetical protein
MEKCEKMEIFRNCMFVNIYFLTKLYNQSAKDPHNYSKSNIISKKNGQQSARNILIGSSEHRRRLARIYTIEKDLRSVQVKAFIHFCASSSIGHFVYFYRALRTYFCDSLWTSLSRIHVF